MTNSTTPGYPSSNDASPGPSDTSLPGASAPATGATYDPTGATYDPTYDETYDPTRDTTHDSTYGATAAPTSAPAAPSAREEAEHLAKDAGDAGRRVAETAKEETKAVGSEARRQARRLADQVGSEVRQQAASQQSRAAGGLRTLGDDFSSMAHGTGSGSGIAYDLARQAGDRFGEAARWLDDREPRDLLEEVKGFARRRPGVFIAIAVGAGVVVGRLTRALMTPDGDSGRNGANGASIGSGTRIDAAQAAPGARMDDAPMATRTAGVPGVPGVADSETVVTGTVVTGAADEAVDPVTGQSWSEGRPTTSSGGIR